MSARSIRRAAERANQSTAHPPSEAEISAARLAANRANAQHSTGPNTSAGKEAVRLNALKTGLTGVTVLLPTEDAEAYDIHIQDYEKHFQPIGPEERALVQSIADTRWRLNRIPALEMAMISVFRLERDDLPEDPDYAIVVEAEIRRMHEREFRNLHLQEARLVRRRERETKELLALQAQRRAKQAEELQEATTAYVRARQHQQPFNLAALGFEFSKECFARHLALQNPPIHFEEHFSQKAEPMEAAA